MSPKGKVVAEIQARTGSSRLPGKVLKPIVGKPMLELLIERVKKAKLAEEVVVATSVNPGDDAIEELAARMRVRCFRGSEQDVLARVVGAVDSVKGDVVIQLWGDAPLIDPWIIDAAVKFYLDNDYDAVATFREKKYPWGMSLFVFPFKIIRERNACTKDPVEREHVSNHIYEHPEKFTIGDLPCPPHLCRPDIRLTVDEQKDFEVVRKIFEHYYPYKPDFDTQDIITFLDGHPEVKTLNRDVKQTVIRKG